MYELECVAGDSDLILLKFKFSNVISVAFHRWAKITVNGFRLNLLPSNTSHYLLYTSLPMWKLCFLPGFYFNEFNELETKVWHCIGNIKYITTLIIASLQGSRRNLPWYYIENQNQNASLTTIVACSNHCGFQMIHIYKDRIIAFFKKIFIK